MVVPVPAYLLMDAAAGPRSNGIDILHRHSFPMAMSSRAKDFSIEALMSTSAIEESSEESGRDTPLGRESLSISPLSKSCLKIYLYISCHLEKLFILFFIISSKMLTPFGSIKRNF